MCVFKGGISCCNPSILHGVLFLRISQQWYFKSCSLVLEKENRNCFFVDEISRSNIITFRVFSPQDSPSGCFSHWKLAGSHLFTSFSTVNILSCIVFHPTLLNSQHLFQIGILKSACGHFQGETKDTALQQLASGQGCFSSYFHTQLYILFMPWSKIIIPRYYSPIH